MSGARKHPLALRQEASRCALASDLSRAPSIGSVGRPTRGCTPCSSENQMQRRPSDAAVRYLSGVGVQPRLKRLEGPIAGALHKWWARAQRLASGRGPIRATRAPDPARVRIALSAPPLVTFLWQRVREKLPAIAGRIPAALHTGHEDRGKSDQKRKRGRSPVSVQSTTRLTTPSADHSPPSHSPPCTRTPARSKPNCSSASARGTWPASAGRFAPG